VLAAAIGMRAACLVSHALKPCRARCKPARVRNGPQRAGKSVEIVLVAAQAIRRSVNWIPYTAAFGQPSEAKQCCRVVHDVRRRVFSVNADLMIRLDNISKQNGHQILFIDASMKRI
jgi:hypothetical protein